MSNYLKNELAYKEHRFTPLLRWLTRYQTELVCTLVVALIVEVILL